MLDEGALEYPSREGKEESIGEKGSVRFLKSNCARTDAMGELLETLDEDKARYDKYFGFETAESKNCLICRKNRISIVSRD